MKKQIHFISLFCVLLTLIAITSSTIIVSAEEGQQKYGDRLVIGTKNCVKSITDTVNNETVNYAMSAFELNPGTFPALTDFGFKYRYAFPLTYSKYFAPKEETGIERNSYIFCSGFDVSGLGNYANTYIEDYYYYLFTFFLGINDEEGKIIDNVVINSRLFDDGNSTYDIVVGEPMHISDSLDVKAYTIAVSSRDIPIDSFGDSVTIGSLFTSNSEIMITPKVSSTATFFIYMSDIYLTLYSETDVLAGGLNNIEDAVNQSTQQIVGAIQNQTTDIENVINDQTSAIGGMFQQMTDSWLNADGDADPDAGTALNQGTGNLGAAEDAVKDMLTEVGSDTFVTIPTEFTQGVSFVGDLLQYFLDSSFGVVAFFCLSFGVALTLVGRAVR